MLGRWQSLNIGYLLFDMGNEILIKKSYLYFGAVTLIVIVLGFVFLSNSFNAKVILVGAETLEEKFLRLSQAKTNSCGGTFDYVASKPDEDRIQGSCCGAMDFHRYTEQLEGLVKYSEYEIIPSDPYNIPVSLAKELLDYQKNIQLATEQQEIYDKATVMSMEGGPCCCKCWHWYAYEGLAKYLIVEEGFSAEQIAVWDLSDACRGSGHVDGTAGH